jgi:ankyrin repeat protein
MQDRFHDIDSAVAGTCEWLLQHETYKTWAACDHGLLWVKGKPGTGKSTLVKYALGSHRGTNNTLVLSFFFHGRGDELQRTPLGLFRSLLHQILAQAPNALHDLVDRFESRRNENGRPGKDWNWREAELKPFLMSSLLNTLKARPIWLFVDALDECGKDNAVRLVGLFKTMLKSAVSQPDGVGRQFHICFSCRHYPILDVDKNTFEICVEDENERDIRTFVYGQLAAFRTQTSSRIPALIMERAAGIFIWAGLVVEKLLDLDREGAGLKKMEATVRSVPPDLDELYRHLIKDMDSASLKLVQLICFATRPLSVDELQWAMVIDADCPYQSLQACQSSEDYVPDSDRMKRRIQTLSRGLAEITQTQVVQFIHQSVKDFFVKEGVLASDGCQTSTEAAIRANLRLAKICIRYLAMEEIGQSIIYNTRDFPFLDYAATSLAAHMKQCDGEGVLQHGLLASFAWPSNALVELWTRVQQEIPQCGQSYHRLPQRGNLVHTTAVYGITGLLKAVLEVGDKTIIDKHIDERDMDLRTPLSLAAANGHEAVVELLTGAGKADVEAKDRYGQTPLSWAAANGHHTVVELLVGKGNADVEAKDRYGQTPLSWAAANGHHTVVELLVGKGKADVDSKDRYGHTPLSWAAANGRKTVVEFLVGKGNADVESKDGDGRTPLSLAATNGHQTVVELLVGTGRADVQAKNKDSKTPLSLATAAGHRAVVEFLVDTGRVDVEGKDTTGGTPLLRAAENGHEAVVKSLVVKAKANVEAKDKTGQTPLLVAVKSGHKAVVEFLVNTVKANVNTKDESGSTPLLVAVEGNKQSIVKFLLGTGEVDVDAKDDRGWTPLYLAVKGGHEATVGLLLGTGKVDVNVLSNHSWTPGVLLENVHARHEAIVGLLLGTDKVYINTKDILGQTALFRAVDIESMAIVKSILDTGKADVDSKDNFGRTPLMVAVEKESRKSRGIVKFLLDTGEADVGARSWSRLDQLVGQTVLSLAVIKGHRDIVDLLLTSSTSDAVVDAKDHYGRTPLYLAARGGFKAIVRSLLNTGKVDVHTMDNWGITPLAIAAKRGHEAVVQLLVEAGASAGAAEGKSVERMQ